MELSVRSKFMSAEMLEKRRKMIENENLHINEKITIETFRGLYDKYGENLIEEDFANFFLDLSDMGYDKFKKGKTVETSILSYEYVSNEEFESIRKRLIEIYGLKHGDRITYEQLMEMHSQFGGRLSMQLFVEEILGISVYNFSELRLGRIKRKPINFEAEAGKYNVFHKKNEKVPMYVLNPEYIYELRKRLVTEARLHIGDNISYAQIQELNRQYCPQMPENLFAQKIIDMSAEQYACLKRANSDKPVNGFVFQYADITDSYINSIQTRMIDKYKLESGQLLQYEEFESLYKEYGGILSRKSFATLILVMSDRSYSSLETKVYKSVSILITRKGTNFDTLREQIIKEYGFHYKDLIEYEKFKKLHQMFAPNTSEFVFAEKVFGISSSSFQRMKYRERRAEIHLKMPNSEEMKRIQKKVILETGMYINDKINYIELEKLHKLYGGVIPIRIFATKILCLDEHSFYRIKNDEKAEAFVLFNLEISEAEIEKIKQTIIEEYDLKGPKRLSLTTINSLYTTYGGIMPFLVFVREVLGISTGNFKNLVHKKCDTTMACIRKKFSVQEVTELKRYLAMEISEDEIATQMGVTVAFLKISIRQLIASGELTDSHMQYEKVKVLVEQERSPEEIADELHVTATIVKKMLSRYRREQIQEMERQKEEKQQKRVTEQEQRNREKTKTKAEEILEEYNYNGTNIKEVREYMDECKKSFERGQFPKEELNFLRECMIFVQCDCKEIELFCEICIKFKAYRMAGYFIMENIDNEDILPEERTKLMQLQENIKFAIRKNAAIDMIRAGTEDTSQIAERVGLLETDVIRIKKKLQEARMAIIEGNSKQTEGEDWSIG